MKHSRFLRLLILPALTAACFTTAINGFSQQTTPAADEATPPQPPMQGKPWTPPNTKLPPVVVSAVKELFDQGMADPRGCEYREVEIFDLYELVQKVHAWVLPGDGKKRFAVGWNGRVFPLVSVGAPVDLKKDFPLETGGGFYSRNESGVGDISTTTSGDGGGTTVVRVNGSLSESSVLPIKVAMLLRLGEAGLAEEVWDDWKGNNEDPYLSIAREWLVSWYYSARNLARQGSTPQALQAFRKLLPLKQAAEISAARRNLPFPMTRGDSWAFHEPPEEPGKFYFEELESLPQQLADLERRAKEPAYVPVLKSGVSAAGPERVTALIRDLEGVLWLTDDPTIRALIREGDSAIDPLLKCLEEDNRLTVGEDPVYGAAYAALAGIMKINPAIKLDDGEKTDHLTPAQRTELARQFRDYHTQGNGAMMPQRWFAILQDDNASPKDWGAAAENLTERPGSMMLGANLFSPHEASGGGRPDLSEPMRGESLRAKSDPSLSDLLVKRARHLLDAGASAKDLDSVPANWLMNALADWDGKGRAGDLQKLTMQYSVIPCNRYNEPGFDACAGFYLKRIAAGDPTALADYAVWLSSFKPDPKKASAGVKTFRIMWEHPGDPAIRKAADEMFGGTNPPWNYTGPKVSKKSGDEFWPSPGREQYFASLVNTPMLGMAAYRGLLLKALDDTAIIGFITPYEDEPDAGRDYLYESFPGSEAPEKNSRDFRRCDYYAHLLANADAFPAFNLMWPRKKRDEAVARCKTLLKQYGDAFQFNSQDKPGTDYSRQDGDVHTRIAFPKLDHPATPEDVAQGRAIFSLKGTVRMVPLPAPIHAERPSSPQDAEVYNYAFPHGRKEHGTSYDIDGTVWQAEEVLIDGKWQRYYGFAGRHQLEKVPAEQIEFRGGYPWVGVTADLDAALEGPQVTKPGAKPSTADHVASPGAPLPMAVVLRNRGDAPQEAPGALIVSPAAGKLPEGLNLSLVWIPTIPRAAYFPDAPAYEDWGFSNQLLNFDPWSEVPPRRAAAAAATAADNSPRPSVAAGAEATVFHFDLRDYFDLTRAGSYMVTATFHIPGGPVVKSQEVIFSIVEKMN